MTSRPLPLVWRWIEAGFERAYGIEPLSSDPDCLIAFNRATYQGRPLSLAGAEDEPVTLRPGDPILELHFRREALLPLISDGDPARMAIGLLKLGNRDFPLLAREALDGGRFAGVRAFHAVTMFHRGCERYGFSVSRIEERTVEWWLTCWQRLLMARDHPRGMRHVWANRQTLVPRHIWLSRERLIRLRAEGSVRRPPPAIR